jgi:hypothetical protein
MHHLIAIPLLLISHSWAFAEPPPSEKKTSSLEQFVIADSAIPSECDLIRFMPPLLMNKDSQMLTRIMQFWLGDEASNLRNSIVKGLSDGLVKSVGSSPQNMQDAPRAEIQVTGFEFEEESIAERARAVLESRYGESDAHSIFRVGSLVVGIAYRPSVSDECKMEFAKVLKGRSNG